MIGCIEKINYNQALASITQLAHAIFSEQRPSCLQLEKTHKDFIKKYVLKKTVYNNGLTSGQLAC